MFILADIRLKNLCEENIPLFPKCSYSETFNTDFKMQFHKHKTIEIMYATNNEFIVELLNSGAENLNDVRKVFVPTKHYILINSDVFHRLVIKTPQTTVFNIEFLIEPKTMFNAKLGELYENSNDFKKFVDTDENIYVLKSHKNDFSTFNKIQQELFSLPMTSADNTYFGEDFVEPYLNLQHYTFLFFLQTAKSYFTDSEKNTSKYVNKTIQYINQYLYDESLSTKTIAEHLHLNASYLSAHFKKYTAMNISHYINRRRIIQAMHLLSTTSIPVNQIAVQVGFNNRQHFARLFKSIAKSSPLQYRKATQNNTLKNYVEDEAYTAERLSEENEPI